jgi:hypothetical protein
LAWIRLYDLVRQLETIARLGPQRITGLYAEAQEAILHRLVGLTPNASPSDLAILADAYVTMPKPYEDAFSPPQDAEWDPTTGPEHYL